VDAPALTAAAYVGGWVRGPVADGHWEPGVHSGEATHDPGMTIIRAYSTSRGNPHVNDASPGMPTGQLEEPS
jgi:hypothetical protein